MVSRLYGIDLENAIREINNHYSVRVMDKINRLVKSSSSASYQFGGVSINVDKGIVTWKQNLAIEWSPAEPRNITDDRRQIILDWGEIGFEARMLLESYISSALEEGYNKDDLTRNLDDFVSN